MRGREHMNRYAVKIGEVHLVSDKPISEEERKAFILMLAQGFAAEMLADGAIAIRPQP